MNYSYLNKNYLFKFEISITSLSVTVNLPYLLQQTPIKANCFKYSHPKAPTPTMKILKKYNYLKNYHKYLYMKLLQIS